MGRCSRSPVNDIARVPLCAGNRPGGEGRAAPRRSTAVILAKSDRLGNPPVQGKGPIFHPRGSAEGIAVRRVIEVRALPGDQAVRTTAALPAAALLPLQALSGSPASGASRPSYPRPGAMPQAGPRTGAGRLVVDYQTLEQLDEVIRRLRRSGAMPGTAAE